MISESPYLITFIREEDSRILLHSRRFSAESVNLKCLIVKEIRQDLNSAESLLLLDICYKTFAVMNVTCHTELLAVIM